MVARLAVSRITHHVASETQGRGLCRRLDQGKAWGGAGMRLGDGIGRHGKR